MYQFDFEKLDVWKNALNLTLEVYKITSKYPKDERFNLIDQTRRASTSRTSNLAEGTSRNTNKDQARFT